MKYKQLETNSDGQLRECLKCGNEDLVEGATHCHICGQIVINHCLAATNESNKTCTHSDPLPGNARFCPYCGASTTFTDTSLLQDYTSEKNESEEIIENDGLNEIIEKIMSADTRDTSTTAETPEKVSIENRRYTF